MLVIILLIRVVGFVVGIARSRIVSPASSWVVVTALLVMAAARFFPVGAVELYAGPAAGILALVAIAYAVSMQPQVYRAEQRQRHDVATR